MMNEKQLLRLRKIDSTNRFATDNFAALEDGTLVLAEEQTAGKGRQGRAWVSPPLGNIYCSLVVKRHLRCLTELSMIGGLSVLDTLREYGPELDLWLKWPNDVYCGTRKICGILAETVSGQSNVPAGMVIGIGININMPSEVLAGIDQPATSLLAETGRITDIRSFEAVLFQYLQQFYNEFSVSANSIFERWRGENRLVGKRIEFIAGDGVIYCGILRDIGRQGELLIQTDAGIKKFFSGDLHLDKTSF